MKSKTIIILVIIFLIVWFLPIIKKTKTIETYSSGNDNVHTADIVSKKVYYWETIIDWFYNNFIKKNDKNLDY